MRILGIDPGLAIMGFGIVDVIGNKYKPVTYGVIRTKSRTPMPNRLECLYNELTDIIEKWEPDEVAFEELFFNKNVKTAIMVAQARGVEILASQKYGLKTYEYTPLQVKQGLIGYGRAEKRQVQEMVKILLHLKEIPKPDDAADALAVAITHGNGLRFKEQFRMK
ncbi:MAG: crossover junction endodeoxyribonuclease RuvC [Tissierellia bacterium]|nr:crossover junction endodeoxyribonuclease RuvC [Tissierellia bacterium]